MTKFSILGKWLTNAEIEALKGLACEAGASPGTVTVVNAIEGLDQVAEDDDVILVLGTAPVCADSELEATFVKAANGPRRVIWVWPQDATSELPAPAKKYCYSYVPWHADKLRAVVADDDLTCFETAAGEPVPKVHTERNLCVEEKVSAK